MGTYWDAFVDEFPRHEGETDRAYLERFYSWLDAFSIPTKHAEHITDLMRQLAEAQAALESFTIHGMTDVRALWANGKVCEECSHALCVYYRGLLIDRDALQATLEQAREAVRGLTSELEAGAWTLYRQKAILKCDRDWLLAKAQKAKAALDAGKEAGE